MPKSVPDVAAAGEALKFFAWAYKNGDKAAEELDYVAMPDSVKKLVEVSLERDQGHRRQVGRLALVAPGRDWHSPVPSYIV